MAKSRYGAAHVKARRLWAPLVDRGEVSCCLCGQPLAPGTPWDLDHMPGTDQYRGAAHQSCNRSDGAVRRNRRQGRPTSRTATQWDV